MSPVRLLCTANQRVRKRAGVSILVQVLPGGVRCFPMLSDVSPCFPIFPDVFRCLSDARVVAGRQNKCILRGHYFLSDAFPMSFRCLSDVFPMPFRCVSDASDGISDVCGALSDVSNVFLFSLNVRCFSCFECLTVKICKGRGAMFSDDTGAGFISEKNCGFPQIFLQSPGIHFFLLKMERPALKVNGRQNDLFFLDSF